MNDETKDALKDLEESINMIENFDNSLIKTTNQLRVVLLNLKIEGAKLHEKNGIGPAVDELEKIMERIKKETMKIALNTRQDIKTDLKKLENSINNEKNIN